jgi:DNA-directed RNA polymerase subunit omega
VSAPRVVQAAAKNTKTDEENTMARVSAEDCLARLPNRFALCMLAAKRARELAAGRPPLVECDNKFAVTSLREIAAGKVSSHESLKEVLSAHTAQMAALEGQRALLPARGRSQAPKG